MAGVLHHHIPVNFMGRMESFEHDWAALCAMLGVNESRCSMDAAHGAHPSSVDGRLWTPVHRRVLSQNLAALQALCLILLPDFACFRYPLPHACVSVVAELVRERYRPRRRAKSRTVLATAA